MRLEMLERWLRYLRRLLLLQHQNALERTPPASQAGVLIRITNLPNLTSRHVRESIWDLTDILLGFVIIGLASLGAHYWIRDSKSPPSQVGWEAPASPSVNQPHAPAGFSPPPVTLDKSRPAQDRKSIASDAPVPDTAPEVIHIVRARYTDQARHAGFRRKLSVVVVVNEQGLPVKMEPTGPIPFDLAIPAWAAVQQWRFRPALLSGKPVAARTLMEVPFY